jgi:hypothetical protein
MAVKRFKKNDSSKNLRELAENEYLKRLERAITGKSGENLYLKPGDDRLIQQTEDVIDVWERIEPKIVSQKEPPRIPIEWALGEHKDQPPPVEEKSQPKTLSIEEVIEETAPPQPEESLIPPPSPITQKTLPPEPKTAPEPKALPELKAVPEPQPSLVKSLYDPGTIIRLEDGSVSIYKGPIPGKEYHLIYHLRHDGNISPEGIYLYAYRSEPLGRINEDLWEEMLRSMRWERDRIIEHLSSQEKMRLIPLLSPKVIKKEVAEPLRKRNPLERGRRLRIGFGDHIWDAVYWGSDELGQIVAHNTNKTWTLMHLNLGRFGDSLEYGELLTPEELKDINVSLSETLSVGD